MATAAQHWAVATLLLWEQITAGSKVNTDVTRADCVICHLHSKSGQKFLAIKHVSVLHYRVKQVTLTLMFISKCFNFDSEKKTAPAFSFSPLALLRRDVH